MAYLLDCHLIPDMVIEFLAQAKLDLLFIDCVQPLPHRTHLGAQNAFPYIRSIAPKAAALAHISHHFDHHELQQLAQDSFDFPVFPAYDGLQLEYSPE